jgi:hypothetical protein
MRLLVLGIDVIDLQRFLGGESVVTTRYSAESCLQHHNFDLMQRTRSLPTWRDNPGLRGAVDRTLKISERCSPTIPARSDFIRYSSMAMFPSMLM